MVAKQMDSLSSLKKRLISVDSVFSYKAKLKPVVPQLHSFQKSKSHSELQLKSQTYQEFKAQKERQVKLAKQNLVVTKPKELETESANSNEPQQRSRLFSKSSDVRSNDRRNAKATLQGQHGPSNATPTFKLQGEPDKLKTLMKLEMSKSPKSLNRIYPSEEKNIDIPQYETVKNSDSFLNSDQKSECALPNNGVERPYKTINENLIAVFEKVESKFRKSDNDIAAGKLKKEARINFPEFEVEEYAEIKKSLAPSKQKLRYTFQG